MLIFQASSDDEVPSIMQSKPVPCDQEKACSTEYFDLPGLYSSGVATTPLYEGSHLTVLQALVQYFTWFCEHPGMSKSALSSMLSMQHSTFLPQGNNLPVSYDAALRAIEPFLVKPIVYHVCLNDCIVFMGQHAQMSECPKCGASRYISENSATPVRTFTYLPVGPRLIRFFGTANIAKILQNHSQECETEGKMYDIHHSPAWQSAYEHNGIFKGDERGISFALCTDGVNPFNHNKVSYSMWPIMLSLLNLPRRLRNRFGSIMLAGIVPANGSKEPQNLNPYLGILVDELLELSNTKMYDAYQEAPFTCKVAVLLHVLDYPGIGKVFGVTGSGAYQGCVWCDEAGERDENLQKMVYLQNRRFLPLNSPLRKDNVR